MLAFEVILCHYWVSNNGNAINNAINSLRAIAAPTFFALSFYLCSNRIIYYNEENVRKRNQRIRYPFFIWGLIAWIVYEITYFDGSFSKAIMLLFWQITTGHSVNSPLWFLFNLYVITNIYCIIFRIKKKNVSVVIICILTIGSLLFQYSGFNMVLFGDLAYEVRYPLGRIAEMIPYASFGLLLAIISKYNDKGYLFLFVGISGLGLYLLYPNIMPVNGFSYSGISKIVGSLSSIMVFLSINVSSCRIKRNIQGITAHTLGIFCMHTIVGSLLERINNEKSFMLCIVIYAACYAISHIISIFEKTKCLVD